MTTVLHIITSLDAGGAERMLAQVVAGPCRPADVRQVVVSLMDEGVHGPQLQRTGVTVHCLRMRRGILSPRALWALVGILRAERPDVVMTWLYHADLVATMTRPLAGRFPLVWNLRCSQMDFSRHRARTGLVVRLLALLSGSVPAMVAANSEAGRRAHEHLGYHPGEWVYLPNGFDLDVWRPDPADRAAVRAELGIAEDEPAVVVVARVDPQKDHDTFLAAAKRLAASRPRTRFVLVGRKTATLALPDSLRERTIALGERSDVPRLLRGMDVLALSSAYGEGFPNVVGEAMASEVPCVVTDVGDAAHIVGDTGLVVPPRDPSAMAEALGRLLDESRERRLARGRAARERVKENWPVADVVRRYADLWRDILAR